MLAVFFPHVISLYKNNLNNKMQHELISTEKCYSIVTETDATGAKKIR